MTSRSNLQGLDSELPDAALTEQFGDVYVLALNGRFSDTALMDDCLYLARESRTADGADPEAATAFIAAMQHWQATLCTVDKYSSREPSSLEQDELADLNRQALPCAIDELLTDTPTAITYWRDVVTSVFHHRRVAATPEGELG